jgi:hypothetical protein
MPNGFMTVPDWFSSENQGGNIALTDLDGNGQLDILVLLVDHPIGQNQGFYKVGKNLDSHGAPTGGWGDWQAIPDWFSSENQGAGIAVADLNGNGRPDLIVFMIDNPVRKNQGMYRVGKDLGADGKVTGGWTAWTDVPDWFSWENDGGAIAVADLDGDGRPELLVFMIDAPVGLNQGLYKIGRSLDGDGNVIGGWTGWLPVPDWFSNQNQGAGIAVTDLRNNGGRDVVFFQIDDAPTQNQAFFKIAPNMAVDGTVPGEWSPWLGVPGWFSWQNQGGGIAIGPLEGPHSHDLIAFGIDNPIGQNSGLYRVVVLDSVPTTQGQFELLPYDSQVLAVHAAVLPHGKILFFAGSGNNGVRFASPDFGDMTKEFWCSVVWDYTASMADGKPHFFHPDTLRGADGRPVDFFCGGETLLADGRLLAAGGTQSYDVDAHNQPKKPGFQGRRDALTFDLTTQQWTAVASMAHGRWYPTLITLGDGRLLAGSGLDVDGSHTTDLEIYTDSPTGGSWSTLADPSHLPFDGLPLYPHLFQIADGRVLYTGGHMDDFTLRTSCLIDIAHNPVQHMSISGLQAPLSRSQSASVMLAPAQDQKFLVLGGALPTGEDYATDSVSVIDLKDLSGPLPSFRNAASLLLPRVHLNTVLLPDRTVFVSGGALDREGGKERRILARYQSEIYDPATDTWKLGATAKIARMYHSIALLLEDGRVVIASGNPDKGSQVQWEPQDPNEELRIEIYSPPYLFQGARPTIASAPTTCTYGETLTIKSPDAGTIQWASLIRNGVTTHSFNFTQRVVDLEIVSKKKGQIQGRVPAEANIAPPGFYMLFLVNDAGIPSVASWIKLA